MRLIIAGGGTGGHLFPGIAVAEEFLAHDPANEILFIGTESGIEARAVPAAGYKLELISAAGICGKSSFSQLTGIAKMFYGYAQSRKVLKDFRPDIVLGVGGYASLPMLLAAGGMCIPRFIHEQNAIPGQTNRLLARFVDRIFITLEESSRYFPKEKTLLTGNPLRRQILDMIEKNNSPRLQVDKCSERSQSAREDDRLFKILIFGGSQGAHAINIAMVEALPLLKDSSVKLEIVHQTGKMDYETVAISYRAADVKARVIPFISDMASEYDRTDLIICRAGATTIAEVTACGKACLFIPFPDAVDDHQRRNAEALLKKEACFMLQERELSGGRLAAMIIELASDNEILQRTGALAFSLSKLDASGIIVKEMVKCITDKITRE